VPCFITIKQIKVTKITYNLKQQCFYHNTLHLLLEIVKCDDMKCITTSLLLLGLLGLNDTFSTIQLILCL